MPKIAIQTVENLENQPSALESINGSLTALQNAFDEVLFREGAGALEDNHMVADLDMNSQRILNLPEPSSDLEPMRLLDFQEILETGLALPPDLEDRIGALEDEKVASEDVDHLVVLTQAAYDLLTPDPRTLYFIEEE